MSLNITAFHMTGWHEIVQTFIPHHFLLHGNMVHGIVRCPLFRVAGWFNSIDLVFFGAQLNFAFDLVHHIPLNWQPKYKKNRFQQVNRWKLSPNKVHKLNKNPELDPTRKNTITNLQCHICFFHLPSIQHGMTGHEKPSSTAGGGEPWGQLQIWISIVFLQQKCIFKRCFLGAKIL